MSDPASRTRKRWYLAGAILPLVLVLIWAVTGMSGQSPDDPAALLNHATASNATAEPKPTGKVVAVETTSSSGRKVQARLPEVRDGSGNVGYALHLGEALKPGETATLKMPGGGSITIGAPKDGEAPKPPIAPKKAPAR